MRAVTTPQQQQQIQLQMQRQAQLLRQQQQQVCVLCVCARGGGGAGAAPPDVVCEWRCPFSWHLLMNSAVSERERRNWPIPLENGKG